MGIIDGSLDKITALCVGTTAMAFGMPSGALEASVAAAGLVGFVLGRRQRFGPESHRVRQRIQAELLKNYASLVSGSDGDTGVHHDLVAANEALDAALERCIIDRQKLAEAAVTPKGFPEQAVDVVMQGLGAAHPEFFSSGCIDSLPYRFARDVVRAGITAAVADADYYRQLEPQLAFEMARALGAVRQDVSEIKLTIEQIREEYRRELDLAKRDLHATETDLVGLLTFILQKRVSRENLLAALEQGYERLSHLRENMGDLRSLGNEIPEISSLLEKADAALSSGKGFSLDEAEKALAVARSLYREIIIERENEVKRDKENLARILGKEAEIASVKLDYEAATQFYREQLRLRTEALGPNHLDTATSYNSLASNLHTQGRHAEAELLYRRALDFSERVLGQEHPNTATSYNNVAYSLYAQGRHAEAEPLFRSALDISERVLGQEHPNTATNYNNLATNLDGQGRHAEAEPLYRKALDLRERMLGQEHPQTATSYNNLAANLDGQGRHAEAEPLYRRALDISERMHGQEHPQTATNYNNLAYSLDGQGRHAEAESLFRKALDIGEWVFGQEHPQTATSYNNLAVNLSGQGRHNEAEPLYRRALDISERVLGQEHPHTATSYSNLASNLQAQGRHSEAEPLDRRALDISERVHGQEHSNTATNYSNLASNLHTQGRDAEAEPLYRMALDISERVLGREHPQTATSYNNLAVNLSGQGRNNEAEPLFRMALDISERVHGQEHPRTATIKKNLEKR